MRCEIDSLAPGQTETITITARLAPDSRGKTVLNNIAAISDSVDPNPALAIDTVSFVPIPAADLELTKVAPPDPVAPGAVARYTFQIANRGPSDAPDVTVRDTLPDGLTFVGDTAGACSAAGRAVTCALGALDAGDVARAGRRRPGRPLARRPDRAQHRLGRLRARRPDLAPAEVVPSSNADADDLVVAPLAPPEPPPPPPPGRTRGQPGSCSRSPSADRAPGWATCSSHRFASPTAATRRRATSSSSTPQAAGSACGARSQRRNLHQRCAVSCPLGDLAAGATAEVELRTRATRKGSRCPTPPR